MYDFGGKPRAQAQVAQVALGLPPPLGLPMQVSNLEKDFAAASIICQLGDGN